MTNDSNTPALQLEPGLQAGPVTTVDDEDIYDFPYRKPEELGLVESWKKEIWNPETRQFFGRTGKSWGEFSLHKTSY
jgi:hypothetical protein